MGLLALAGVLLCLACAEEQGAKKLPVLIGADPPSIVAGQTITVALTSTRKFFTEKMEGSFVSDQGLVLESLVVRDSKHAVGVVQSTLDTVLGSHAFEIGDGDRLGTLEFSVLDESPGPGSVTAYGNIATAGAKSATLQLMGEGTHFDLDCTVEVLGANGFYITSVELQTANWIDVHYDITLEQEPVIATVILRDGYFEYEVPFTVTSPEEFNNTVVTQYLTKGRVGEVVVDNPDALLNGNTYIETSPGLIEAGQPTVLGGGGVSIPVRLLFNYAADSVDLVAKTYSEGGAVLEMVHLQVDLLEPAYLAVSPARFPVPGGLWPERGDPYLSRARSHDPRFPDAGSERSVCDDRMGGDQRDYRDSVINGRR